MPLEYLQRLRTQYPEYSDIPDQDLARRIIEKYPQYQDALGDIAAGNADTPQTQPATDPGAEILGGVSSQGAAKTLPEENAAHVYFTTRYSAREEMYVASACSTPRTTRTGATPLTEPAPRP